MSRTSSLSMRGSLRVKDKEWARVDFPVPGWPFIAINIGILPPLSSTFAISKGMQILHDWGCFYVAMDPNGGKA